MPTPYIFASRTELVQLLHSEATKDAASRFFECRVGTVADVVTDGVGSNTYRAFHHLPVPPSLAFREWTTQAIGHSMDRILAIQEPGPFAAFVHETTLALDQYWREREKAEMGYGRGSKLLNLVLKKLICLETIPAGRRQVMLPLLHVPLDSYTILGLRVIAPELRIPRNATMKFIASPVQYRQFQALIADICGEAHVPSIYFDILAWDKRH